MDFGILGPVRVAGLDGEIKIGGAKPRATLALLLLHSNRLVTMSQLVDSLWEGESPQGARMAVQGHIKRLRQMLGQNLAGRLETRPPGYQLSVTEGELDLYRFQVLVRRGRSAAGSARWDEAAGSLTRALTLWRGEPLQDVPQSSRLRNEAERLTELRLQTTEWRIDAEMHLGRSAELVPELRQLTAAYPLQERFHGQLMLTLYRSGRQAEALAAFQLTRANLIEELGVEPGVHLQDLYRQILAGDQARDATPAAVEPIAPRGGRDNRAVAAEHRPVPNQLPADLPDFTGRAEEISNLLATLDSTAPRPMILVGAGGMGKTALALHIAHRLSGRYPDGRLYLPLRASGGPPPAPTVVLGRVLRALGVGRSRIPRDEEDRLARYRSMLSTRRILIVVDDAASTDQVSALVPGTSGSAVLVTTRRRSLAVDGAGWMFLTELLREDARALVGRIIGPGRAAAEPEAIDRLIDLCASLPLAIRIASTRLVVRPSWTVEDLARILADDQRRLIVLAADGHDTRLRPALGHGSMSPDLARAFRLLAASRIRILSPDAVGAMLDTTVDEGRRMAELLVDLNLLYSPSQDRYRYRDLQYLYARTELVATAPVEQGRAVRRLTDHYLSALDAGTTPDETVRDNIVALASDNSGCPVFDPIAAVRLRRYLRPSPVPEVTGQHLAQSAGGGTEEVVPAGHDPHRELPIGVVVPHQQLVEGHGGVLAGTDHRDR
jgi:DNA-binding SARP family transcriptional activator